MLEISQQDFEKLTGFIKKNYGLDLTEKKVLIESRLSNYIMDSGYNSFEEYLQYADEREIYTFMLDGAKKLHEIEKADKYTLVFGNEATGLPEEYHRYGKSVFIEQLDTIDSLNLDNAVSIASYEFTRGKLGK